MLLDAGYEGVFDLELIGDAIVAEGYDAAVPRASMRSGPCSTTPRLTGAPIAGGPHSEGGRRGTIGISKPSIAATRVK